MYRGNLLLLLMLLIFGRKHVDGEAQSDHLETKLAAFQRSPLPLMEFDGTDFHGSDSTAISCYGEGLYSHPFNCTKFYRCLDVFGTAEYLSLLFTCESGTIFSASHKSCVPGTCSPGLVSAIALAMDHNTTLDLNHKALDSSPQIILTNNKSRPCQTEGRVADPDDCGQYFDCVRSTNGGLIAYKQSCNGLGFDMIRRSCVPVETVKGCIPGINEEVRSANFGNKKVNEICEKNKNKFLCLDCKTLLMCAEAQPHILPCKEGNVCHSNTENFNGGVCYPAGESECSCKAENAFQPDIYDSTKFLTCGNSEEEPVLEMCPDGLEFNGNSCGTPIDTKCLDYGTFVLQPDCSMYHSCSYTQTGMIQSVYKCPDKTLYNEKNGHCEDPCNWYSGDFKCEKEGRFPNPEDCARYFECTKDANEVGKFTKKEYKCPEGFVWFHTGDTGHHCVPRNLTEVKCEEQNPDKCRIPKGWCEPIEVPTEFERLEDGRIIRRTRTSDPESTYQDAIAFCSSHHQSTPFIPKSAKDVQLYTEVRATLGRGRYMWFPANDLQVEGRLDWSNGEPVADLAVIDWRNGEVSRGNSDSRDCILYGGLSSNGGRSAHFWPCNSAGNTARPPICELIP